MIVTVLGGVREPVLMLLIVPAAVGVLGDVIVCLARLMIVFGVVVSVIRVGVIAVSVRMVGLPIVRLVVNVLVIVGGCGHLLPPPVPAWRLLGHLDDRRAQRVEVFVGCVDRKHAVRDDDHAAPIGLHDRTARLCANRIWAAMT